MRRLSGWYRLLIVGTVFYVPLAIYYSVEILKIEIDYRFVIAILLAPVGIVRGFVSWPIWVLTSISIPIYVGIISWILWPFSIEWILQSIGASLIPVILFWAVFWVVKGFKGKD